MTGFQTVEDRQSHLAAAHSPAPVSSLKSTSSADSPHHAATNPDYGRLSKRISHQRTGLRPRRRKRAGRRPFTNQRTRTASSSFTRVEKHPRAHFIMAARETCSVARDDRGSAAGCRCRSLTEMALYGPYFIRPTLDQRQWIFEAFRAHKPTSHPPMSITQGAVEFRHRPAGRLPLYKKLSLEAKKSAAVAILSRFTRTGRA